MKPTKDNFSTQASTYQKFRPIYPSSLYHEIFHHVPDTKTAWDCGTGNGQVALVLADHFAKVAATDISEKQLKNAPAKSNIEYQCCRAEQTNFPNHYFDLITVAQAIHWFDFNPFFEEVKRVAQPGGLLAVWGYGLLRINPNINERIDHFYKNIIGEYWDAERKLVDESYSTIPFPFPEIKTSHSFYIETEWNRSQLEGYLNTWSSVQKYIAKNNSNPVDSFMSEIISVWPEDEIKQVRFPLFLRLGRVN